MRKYVVPIFVLVFAIAMAAYNNLEKATADDIDINPFIRSSSQSPISKSPVDFKQKEFKTGDYIFSYLLEDSSGGYNDTVDYHFGGFSNNNFFTIYPLMVTSDQRSVDPQKYSFYAKQNKIIQLPYSVIKLKIISFNIETDSIVFQIMK
ncbi:hypothetical protein [Priestia aryabhattai]